MKIYTKSGDAGETSLWGGKRVPKNSPRVATYGTLDEANSALGVVLAHFPEAGIDTKKRLIRIQSELFQLGAELASSPGAPATLAQVDQSFIEQLEKEIDSMESELPQLTQFILPGGHPASAYLQVARTLVRRAERECVELSQSETLRSEVLVYLNRLSDFLFVCARFVNFKMGESETQWNPVRKA